MEAVCVKVSPVTQNTTYTRGVWSYTLYPLQGHDLFSGSSIFRSVCDINYVEFIEYTQIQTANTDTHTRALLRTHIHYNIYYTHCHIYII